MRFMASGRSPTWGTYFSLNVGSSRSSSVRSSSAGFICGSFTSLSGQEDEGDGAPSIVGCPVAAVKPSAPPALAMMTAAHRLAFATLSCTQLLSCGRARTIAPTFRAETLGHFSCILDAIRRSLLGTVSITETCDQPDARSHGLPIPSVAVTGMPQGDRTLQGGKQAMVSKHDI